jgi:hypothetical protein
MIYYCGLMPLYPVSHITKSLPAGCLEKPGLPFDNGSPGNGH